MSRFFCNLLNGVEKKRRNLKIFFLKRMEKSPILKNWRNLHSFLKEWIFLHFLFKRFDAGNWKHMRFFNMFLKVKTLNFFAEQRFPQKNGENGYFAKRMERMEKRMERMEIFEKEWGEWRKEWREWRFLKKNGENGERNGENGDS